VKVVQAAGTATVNRDSWNTCQPDGMGAAVTFACGLPDTAVFEAEQPASMSTMKLPITNLVRPVTAAIRAAPAAWSSRVGWWCWFRLHIMVT
jgi:hypothetical protein